MEGYSKNSKGVERVMPTASLGTLCKGHLWVTGWRGTARRTEKKGEDLGWRMPPPSRVRNMLSLGTCHKMQCGESLFHNGRKQEALQLLKLDLMPTQTPSLQRI